MFAFKVKHRAYLFWPQNNQTIQLSLYSLRMPFVRLA